MGLAEKENRYPCDQVVPIEQEPRHHLVFENEFVRAFAVEIAPHDRTLCHHHPHDYLMYVVGDAEIISAAREQEPKRLSYRDGECELLSAGMVHVVQNARLTAFRNVVVELQPRVSTVRRSARPALLREGAHFTEVLSQTSVTQMLEDERAAIFVLQIEPGAEIEVTGPAVVATPYGNKLNPDCLGDVEVKQNPTCDLAWIPPGQAAVLRGHRDGVERAIVFQVGVTGDDLSEVPNIGRPLPSLRAHADEPHLRPRRIWGWHT